MSILSVRHQLGFVRNRYFERNRNLDHRHKLSVDTYFFISHLF